MTTSTSTGTILVVDDDTTLRRLFSAVLRKEGHTVDIAPDGVEALRKIGQNSYDLILLDLTIGPEGGIALLDHIRRILPESISVFITGHATVESAVEALKKGAHDYLVKPVHNDQLVRLADRVLGMRRLEEENRLSAAALDEERQKNRVLMKGIREQTDVSRLIGSSRSMQSIRPLVEEVVRSDSTVLIHGESGTGKSTLARMIHCRGHRAEKPFIEINCGVYAEGLLMSELFGHEAGAFTGATRQRKGRLEVAEGGTVFLDEIGDIPPLAQVALLRFLQERCFERVGGEETLHADVRVIAATNSDLEARMGEGLFREDLYYRLNVIPIHVPPLRDRHGDLAPIAERILADCSRRLSRPVERFSPEALDRLSGYSWPGNIRELQNVVEHAVTLCHDDIIRPEHLPLMKAKPRASEATAAPEPRSSNLGDQEREHILDVLEETRWNKKKAASLLGISRSSLYNKLRRFGVQETGLQATAAQGRVQDHDS